MACLRPGVCAKLVGSTRSVYVLRRWIILWSTRVRKEMNELPACCAAARFIRRFHSQRKSLVDRLLAAAKAIHSFRSLSRCRFSRAILSSLEENSRHSSDFLVKANLHQNRGIPRTLCAHKCHPRNESKDKARTNIISRSGVSCLERTPTSESRCAVRW